MLMPLAFLVSALTQFVLGLVLAWIMGPAEFGRYALALAAAIILQTLVFDWLRLAATRFHHASAGVAAGLTRMHLRLGLAAILLGGAVAGFASGERVLVGLLPFVAFGAGYVEFRAALRRAEFDQFGYAALMLARNIAAIVAMPASAAMGFGAEGVLVAYLATLAIAALGDGAFCRSPAAEGAARPDIPAFAAYAMPIVGTNLIYLLLFFGMRAGVAQVWGLAEAGRFSLALEFVLKLFTTIGTALDLLLFQLAVKAAREEGGEAGNTRLLANLRLVLAVIAPMALGLAMVRGGIEAVIVSPAFRGAFAEHIGALMPGIALYAFLQYAVHPFSQLNRRTGDLPLAGLAALAAAVLAGAAGLMAGLAPAKLAGGLLFAAIAAALAIAGQTLRGRRMLDARFAAGLVFSLAMLAAGVGLIGLAGSGFAATAGAITAGVLAYSAAAYATDLAGFRGLIARRRRD